MTTISKFRHLRVLSVERTRRVRGQRDELPERLERDFDRRALLPRLLVLLVLGAAALLEYGQGHRLAHWVVLVVYGATTVALAHSARFAALAGQRAWLPVAATIADAGLTAYVIADHLPRDAHDALHATDTVSLLPAFLLLLQTGLRLRRDLVALFAGIVAIGWIASLALIVGSDTLFKTSDGGTAGEVSVATRQALGLMSFAAAAGFVHYAVHQMRIAASDVLRARLDRMLLSRFLPEGVAAEVVRGDAGAAAVTKRHACLLAVDLRGFSVLTRERPSAEVIAFLMEFRRIVHDAVSVNLGIVDKYVGDGVLALFLDGTPETQAERAFATVRRIAVRIDTWNDERQRGSTSRRAGRIRTIAALHEGLILAGVFDDGRRAEFTVLGAAMNALARIERRAKEADADFVASDSTLGLLSPSTMEGMEVCSLPRREIDDKEELPDVSTVAFVAGSSSIGPVDQRRR